MPKRWQANLLVSYRNAVTDEADTSTGEVTMAKIDDVRAELTRLEHEEKLAREARRAATVPVYKYSIRRPIDDWITKHVYGRFDVYSVIRTCENEAECKAVGRLIAIGSMAYVYCQVNHIIVCPVSGGLSMINNAEQAYAVGAFIHENPDGGDITHLLND
jgi:hypothetical protein